MGGARTAGAVQHEEPKNKEQLENFPLFFIGAPATKERLLLVPQDPISSAIPLLGGKKHFAV